MSSSENETDKDDEIFSMLSDIENTTNQRIAVRYVRTDISVSLSPLGLFSFSKYLPVKLLDISSKGAAIECKKKLPLKKKIILDLLFEDNKSFSISAKIIHRAENKIQYGLKFDQFNNELGDYLLSSQSDLSFK